MSYLPSLPRGTLLDVFQRHPDIAGDLHVFAETLMRGKAPFSAGERELMAAFVSRLNGCEFCEASHGGVAERFGVDPELTEELTQSIEWASVRSELKPVFEYLAKLARGPDRVNESDVRAILAAGWGEDAVIYANLICGFFSLMNRLVEGLGLNSDAELVKRAAKQLHESGYRSISEPVGDGKTSP